MTYTPLEFKERLSQLKDEIEGMTLTETVCGVGPVVEALDDLVRTVRAKSRGILIAKDAAVEAMKKERQVALDKVIPNIVKCIKESDSLDDATATLVADRFYDEYVLDNLGKVRGKFITYAPSVLSQVKKSFGVFLSTKKAMDSIKKYIAREEVVCRDYPSLVRQVLASLFHTVLAPYKGVLI